MPTPRKHKSNAHRQAAYRKRQELARLAERQREGLPPLPVITAMPGTRRWTRMLENARTLVEAVKQERDVTVDYYDERSAAWQESDVKSRVVVTSCSRYDVYQLGVSVGCRKSVIGGHLFCRVGVFSPPFC